MLEFMRRTTAGYRVAHFPRSEVTAEEQITPWTEVYNYTYFGIPCVQPRFKVEGDPVRETVYHTQLDDASLVDLNGGAEILKLYGTLLIELDRQPAAPYNFSERADSIRVSLDVRVAQAAGVDLSTLTAALDALTDWARQIEARIEQANTQPETFSQQELVKFNDQLRATVQHLLPALYFTEGDFPDSGRYEHLLWQQEWLALDRSAACLEQGDAQGAIEALTGRETGVRGGWYALNVSYPVYYRNTEGSRNPARSDLLWGKDRTIPFNDVWAELRSLQDKLRRGTTNFGSELYTLRQKQARAAADYRAALERLTELLREAVSQLALVRA
jgi:hypothetical protein